MKKHALWLFAAILLVSAVPALAHHGRGGYGDQPFEMTGTVQTDVSLAGPHATMKIKAADGQIWDITLAPPPRTASAGLRQKTIPIGAQVTVHGRRSKDPKRFEIKTERVTYNGKVYNVYPERS